MRMMFSLHGEFMKIVNEWLHKDNRLVFIFSNLEKDTTHGYHNLHNLGFDFQFFVQITNK